MGWVGGEVWGEVWGVWGCLGGPLHRMQAAATRGDRVAASFSSWCGVRWGGGWGGGCRQRGAAAHARAALACRLSGSKP